MSKKDQLRMIANAAEQDAEALTSLYEEVLKANLLKGLQQSQNKIVSLVTGQAVAESQAVIDVMSNWVEQSEGRIVEIDCAKLPLPKLKKPKPVALVFEENNLLPDSRKLTHRKK